MSNIYEALLTKSKIGFLKCLLMKLNRHQVSSNKENTQKINSLKNIHQGKQCIIVATGPSISEVDLSIVKNHPFVMGVNGAYKLDLNLKYFFCSSPDYFYPNKDEILSAKAEKLFLSSNIGFMQSEKLIYLGLDENSVIYRKPNKKFEFDLTKKLSWGPTVVLDIVLPTAIWMGFSEIILLGLDYSLEKYEHFYKREDHHTLHKVNYNEEMKMAHEGFRKFKSHLDVNRIPVKIYNCSDKSELDLFEKKPLEQVL